MFVAENSYTVWKESSPAKERKIHEIKSFKEYSALHPIIKTSECSTLDWKRQYGTIEQSTNIETIY